MSSLVLLFAITLLLVAGLLYGPLRRQRLRRRFEQRPLPLAWEQLLRQRWRLYAVLPVEIRRLIAVRLQLLLLDTRFYGCAGITVTEEMKILILAQASLVYAYRGQGQAPVVLLYPSAYYRDDEHIDEAGVVTRARHLMLGESWEQGKVILSWEDIEQDLAQCDGHNLVIHEYAHQLDGADGHIDGVPPLVDLQARARWRQVLTEAYTDLGARLDQGLEPAIDPYAATAPEEFFAVASEYFFTQPELLLQAYPHIYRELGKLYSMEPTAWVN